jgi:large subunit ribosomal protein L30
MAMAADNAKIRVRLRGSQIGCTTRQRQTVRGLGLRKTGDSRVLEKTPAVLGMIKKVAHIVSVEEASLAG